MFSDHLSDTALVVRAGVMAPGDLRRKAKLCERETGRLGLSVWAAEVATLQQFLASVRPFPNPKLRRSTAGEIRAAGFELTKTGAPRHYTVLLRDTQDATLARFIGAFKDAEDNPMWESNYPHD